jgi:hypothetical protein
MATANVTHWGEIKMGGKMNALWQTEVTGNAAIVTIPQCELLYYT